MGMATGKNKIYQPGGAGDVCWKILIDFWCGTLAGGGNGTGGRAAKARSLARTMPSLLRAARASLTQQQSSQTQPQAQWSCYSTLNGLCGLTSTEWKITTGLSYNKASDADCLLETLVRKDSSPADSSTLGFWKEIPPSGKAWCRRASMYVDVQVQGCLWPLGAWDGLSLK